MPNTRYNHTDLSGSTINYTYDSLGRLATVNPTDEKWADTKITWSMGTSPTRTIVKCTLSGSSCTNTKLTNVTSYNALLRSTLETTTDNIGNNTRYVKRTYKFNQLEFVSNPSTSSAETNGTRYTYDALGRQKTNSLSGFGTQTTSYLSGNKQQVINFNDNSTTTTYLAYSAPSYQQATNIFSPENVTTEMTYNLFGNITKIRQHGLSGIGGDLTEYRVYDNYQRLCMTKRADVGNSAFGYNTLGEMTWSAQGVTGSSCISAPAEKITYEYDNLGDGYKVVYSDATPDITYTITDSSKTKNIAVGSGNNAVNHLYKYFSGGALKSEELTIGSEKTYNLTYDYDNLGALSSLTYPDTTQVNYSNNGFGQPLSASKTGADYATNATYYANGQLNTFTYGNDVTHKTTQNSVTLLPSSINDTQAGTKLLDLSYSYDNQANIKSIIDGVSSSYSLTNLTYDDLDRLTSVTGNSGIGSSSLTYDALGNIKTYSSKDKSLTYGYTSNRLTSLTGTGLDGRSFSTGSYDSRGNVINNGKHGFTYNLANQMTSAQATGNGANTYLYDGYNRRVKQTDGKGTSYSVYTQSGILLYREANVASGSGDPVNYVYLGKKLIAKDGIIADADATARHSRPFGDSIETDKDDVGYTGHKFDADLDLSYMQARYYDPVIGRFYSNDPIGVRDVHSFNRYAYANNNPYKYVDPTGKSGIKLRDVKKALKEVHKKLGGKKPKGKKSKFDDESHNHGDDTKGYRLDKEGHPNDPSGTPGGDGPHINWWDYSKTKRKAAAKLGKLDEVRGAIRVGDTVKKTAASVIGAVIVGVEFMEQKMPRTTQLVEAILDPVGTLSGSATQQTHPNGI